MSIRLSPVCFRLSPFVQKVLKIIEMRRSPKSVKQLTEGPDKLKKLVFNGSTDSGKSRCALWSAEKLDTEISRGSSGQSSGMERRITLDLGEVPQNIKPDDVLLARVEKVAQKL